MKNITRNSCNPSELRGGVSITHPQQLKKSSSTSTSSFSDSGPKISLAPGPALWMRWKTKSTIKKHAEWKEKYIKPTKMVLQTKTSSETAVSEHKHPDVFAVLEKRLLQGCPNEALFCKCHAPRLLHAPLPLPSKIRQVTPPNPGGPPWDRLGGLLRGDQEARPIALGPAGTLVPRTCNCKVDDVGEKLVWRGCSWAPLSIRVVAKLEPCRPRLLWEFGEALHKSCPTHAVNRRQICGRLASVLDK